MHHSEQGKVYPPADETNAFARGSGSATKASMRATWADVNGP
jgi:hypothetical protein